HGPNSRVQLKELHSQGGIGQVWRAYDTVLGREVALKELLPELRGSKRHRERFYREARVAAQLTHPGTAPVYEYREEGGRYYYTMKFFSGRTLTEVIRDKHAAAYEGERVAFDRLFPLLDHFLVVCDAIAYAHAKGIVHRDLKGENVVLGAYGEVTVIDWGLAKSISRAEGRIKTSETNRSETPTLEGERLGTPGFMAPEQARGELSAIDERTDVYGLAAILYELLTKRAPFSGETANEIMHQVETVAPASPSLTHPLTPPELEAICLKGLAKKKEDRYQSARELRHAVHDWIAGQAQLQREAAEQAKFFSLSRDLFVTLDATGDITHVNEAYQRLLRYQGDAPRGVHYAETLHPDDRERAAAVFSSAQRGLSEQDLILRVRYADEGYCPISWSVTRALDEPTIYAVGRPLDEASERRRRAKVVQTLFSLSSDLFVMIDEAGCFAHVNPACNRALGYEHDEMLGEPFAEFLHPEDQQRRQQTFEDTLAGKSVQDYASRMRRSDGGYLLTRWTSAKVPGEPMVYAVGRVLDEAAERRRRAEQLEAFFELSSDLFVSFGDDARVSYANPAYSRLMGRPLDDTIGRTLLERVHPDDRAGTQRVYERAMQGEPTTDFKARIVRHDGEYQPAVWSVAKTIGEPSVYAIGRPLDPESESRRLAAERARFFDLSRDLFVAFDSEGNITHTNPAYEQFFGYSNARSLGKSHRTKVHPDELAYLEERVQSVMSGKPVDDFTLRVEDDNGVYRPVSWSLTKAPGEKVIYAVGRPIDEQTERRRRTEARARFFALSSDVCIAIDPDGSISQVNQAWTDLLGFSPDRTIGKQAIKRVHPDDQQYVARLIESVKQGDSVQDIIIRQENNDGVYVTINWTL
ncbi:MAG: PAS domain S-box protein, partial [Planctomycetota bacterium]